MRDSRSTKWVWVVILAAFVATLTTLSVICLRIRAKKRKLTSFNDSIDYDFDDCCCEDCEGCEGEEDFSDEQPVQIPHAEPDDNETEE